ncbi:CAF17-like 4Fe-4S cluster assembly/insertion protein YgfZ [Phytoactinopolyspora halotolerans]|uniref:Folate-binding protein YgfZ n=1 Tax=Phytoactinopolyspora halotolerans TaxID=1981512 RepID=A0A6L9S4B3_9ACTN|nr:folate-binding protein YgfZ [Phytoactinopolyspora halotolerans]NED99473.1 folate-binding protein YgfZ [Phytoactinopolyspora halotolerans]
MDPTYRSPLLDLPGAVAAQEPDAGVAAHYGDPLREQRQLVSGTGAIDLSHRDVVRVSGPDRLTWLHQLTTQHLERLQPGEATSALILDVNGRVEHALYGVDDGEAIWFHLEPGGAAPLVQYLDSMRFWSQVEVADATGEVAVVWLPGASSYPDDVGGASVAVRVTDRGRDVFVRRERLREFVAGAGSPAGVWAHEALRIAAHEARQGRDTDERTIPHEVGWIGAAVHLDKGCYRGQETVARVHTLGRPPRRLVMLHLDGSVDYLPEHGEDVVADGRTVGFVGSSARHYELGPIALAVVKRNVPTDVALTAGGVAAAQEVVVDPEIGLHVRPQLR